MVSSKWRALAFIEFLILWVIFSRMVLKWDSWQSTFGGTVIILVWEMGVWCVNWLRKRTRRRTDEMLRTFYGRLPGEKDDWSTKTGKK